MCAVAIWISWTAGLRADNTKAVEYYKKACELGGKDRFMSSVAEHEQIWKSSCESYERLK